MNRAHLSSFSVRLFSLLAIGCGASIFVTDSFGLEPVLQDIQPGYQIVTGDRYTYINRGDFVDVYDNKSKALFRSIPVSMDEGAGKGIAESFVVSMDERLVQTRVRVKHVGEIEATFDIATGNPVENRPIAGRQPAVSNAGYVFNDDPTLLPAGVHARPVTRFEKAPVHFHNPLSFIAKEVAAGGSSGLVHVDLIRSERTPLAPLESLEDLRKGPGFDVDLFGEAGASAIRSFPVDEVRRMASERAIPGAERLVPADGFPIEVLCLVGTDGLPRVVASSPYESGHHFVRDLVAREDGRAFAVAWDVLPGRASDLYGIEVRSMSDGSLRFRDESIFADCLSFGSNPDVLYFAGRFGYTEGPFATLKERVVAKFQMGDQGPLLEWYAPAGLMKDLSVDPDEKYLYAVSDDGRLEVFDAISGNVVVNARGYHETALLVSTKDHFFMATGGAEEALALRSGDRAYPLEQFDLHFNQPHLVLDTLEASNTLITNARESYRERLLLHGIETTEFKLAEDLPEMSASIQSESGGELAISLQARSGSAGLARLFAWVNHVPVLGKAGQALSGREFSGTVTLPIVTGDNEIQISVMDAGGMESIRETLAHRAGAQPRPRVVRLLAIGVSDYLGTEFDLDYAAKDARDLLGAFSSEVGAGAEVKVKLLADQDASKAGILSAKSFFEEGGPDDLALVFLAGHGVLDPDTNQFYFCPADMDFDNFAAKGVSYEEIESLFEGIPALRRVILMDCCHAGELTPAELKRLQQSAAGVAAEGGTTVRALRVVNSGVAPQSESTEGSPSYGFRDLRRQVGAQVLSAAGPLEFALEGAGMENGIFTFYVLSGIRGGAADRNRDGVITATELFAFVSEKVIQASDGIQRPRFRHANRAFDFALVGEGDPPRNPPMTMVAVPVAAPIAVPIAVPVAVPVAVPAPTTSPPSAPSPPSPPSGSSLIGSMTRPPEQTGRRYPEASQRILTEAEVQAMSFAQLRYAINELYAAHGFAFASASAAEIRQHFSQFSWFRPDPAMTMEAIDGRMSEIERRNIEILAAERNRKK